MSRQKRVLVACGTAIATSTHVANRLEREFAAHGIQASITQCRVSEVSAYANDVDVIVSTAQISQSLPVPVVSGVPFLTGIGEEEALRQIFSALQGA